MLVRARVLDLWLAVRRCGYLVGVAGGMCPGCAAHGDLQPANALIDPAGRAWLLDFEFARAAPREWDPSKLVVLSRRFGEPVEVGPLLGEWRQLDEARLTVCAKAQEVLIVLWLVRMASEGTAGAAEEARRRAATLAGADHIWRHLS